MDQDEREARELLEAPESEEERRALDALASDPRRVLAAARLRAGPGALRIRRRPAWVIAAGLAAAAAAVLVILAVRVPQRDPLLVLHDAQAGSRALELALSDLPWAPYQPRRGEREADLDRPLRRLLEAGEQGRLGAERSLAALYLMRSSAGDLDRAEQALGNAQGREADNDRGVLSWLRGDPGGALELFLRAGSHFNAALTLERLGARERAVRELEAVVDPGFRDEAAERARALRAPAPPPPSNRRRESYVALLAAETPAQLQQAVRGVQDQPDLLAIARNLKDAQLPEHIRLYKLYISTKERALSGEGPREADDFAQLPAVQADPLLWAPALQLAGYAFAARGDWREAQRRELQLAASCRTRGCAAENEAIALDELAELAGRDGDFASAYALQDRASKIFAAVNATLQLAELQRKRAALLNEENRHTEAAKAAAEATRELAPLAAGAPEKSALAAALEQLAQIEGERGHRLAEREIGEAALDLARVAGNRDLEVDIAALLGVNALARGEISQARAALSTEIARLDQAGHRSGSASLRRSLAEALLAQGDAAGAFAEAERGLQLTPAGSQDWDRVLLHVAHARALRAQKREPEAAAELSQAIDDVARNATSAQEPSDYLVQAGGLLAEASLPATSADELALSLDRLRAAALHVAPAAAGWSRALQPGACVLVLIPAEKFTLQAVARREGGEVRHLAQGGDALAAGTEGCDELWVFAGAPLDAIDLRAATGIATSLTRLLAGEPRSLPRTALFISAPTSGDRAAAVSPLPGAAGELVALLRSDVRVAGLSGARATPELALQLSAQYPLVHFAVHGYRGESLQLAGEGGRLPAREIAHARLQPQTRVVLSACEAGAPGPGGVAWAFARAGAVAVAAAQGKVEDAAAARWSDRFYSALGRGLTFAQSAREAAKEDRAARYIVVK